MVRRIKERLGVPVVCLLQDEDGFLDSLTSPYVEQAWAILRKRACQIDGFLSVSRYYANTMAERLNVGSDRMHVTYMGIDPAQYEPSEMAPPVPTIGFLSRMCANRGMETLVDAFILLKRNADLRSVRLRFAGGRNASDEPFIERMRSKLERAGVLADVEFVPAFDRDAKAEFLKGLSVLSVPEPQPVAYGLYVLEALAMGVPVVEPAIGCFPETIEMTGGGVLYEPNTAERLAEVLTPLLADPQGARKLGMEGREGVCKAFEIARTASETIRVYERIVRRSGGEQG
jgi:glycosyltransferase involved in cell wall biosynthesis